MDANKTTRRTITARNCSTLAAIKRSANHLIYAKALAIRNEESALAAATYAAGVMVRAEYRDALIDAYMRGDLNALTSTSSRTYIGTAAR